MTAKTVASYMITPDGTLLQSYHVHDYKTYKDSNGEIYMIDGGCEYLLCHNALVYHRVV